MDKNWLFTDLDRCMGCRSCELACKEENALRGIEILTIGPNKGLFIPVFTEECNLCEDRVRNGLNPVCVIACPFNVRYICDEPEITARIRKKNRISAMGK